MQIYKNSIQIFSHINYWNQSMLRFNLTLCWFTNLAYMYMYVQCLMSISFWEFVCQHMCEFMLLLLISEHNQHVTMMQRGDVKGGYVSLKRRKNSKNAAFSSIHERIMVQKLIYFLYIFRSTINELIRFVLVYQWQCFSSVLFNCIDLR